MIAILGATGTLGLSLARELAADPRGLVLFARRPDRLAAESFPPQSVFARSINSTRQNSLWSLTPLARAIPAA